jgi:xanthine dehydrogenase molybdenum-binding subunit
MPFYLRDHLADVLGMPEGMVRVKKTTMGSGFGSRMEMHPVDPICALLARKTGRPVKIVYSREEEFSATRFRHPMTIDLKLGAKRNGELVAARMEAVQDCGAYCSQAPGVISVAGTNALSMYNIPNVSYSGKIVYTNNPYGGSFRGYGNSQTTFAVESLMETLAEQLGVDPVALRRMNSRKEGQGTPLGHVITSCGFIQCLDEAAARIGWDEKRGKKGNRGVGLAGLFHVGGGARVHNDNDGCGAFVKVEDNGNVTLITGAQEIGQGANTVLAQIVAEVLGVPLKDVRIENSDTDIMPWDLGCHASRTTFVGGNAARLAAQDAREQLFDIAAQLLEASPRDLIAREGKIWVVGSEDRFITVSQAAKAHHYRSQGSVVLGKGFYDPPTQMPDPVTGKGNKSAAYAFGVQAAEVEVDMATGEVKLLKLVSALDVGRAINPLSAHGQAEGCLAQGVGYALTEDLVFDQGKIVNPSFADYKIPAAPDMPLVESVLVETIDPQGPFGAKGMGESGLVPTAPAIANAVYDATGVKIKELPITPENLLRAIKEKLSGI